MAAGKVAIITGAAGGLGKSFTEALLKNGAKVCIADVNSKAGQDTEKELCDKYGTDSAFFMQCDVRNQTEFENLFKETKQRYNGVHLLCNNAGILHEGKWEEMIDINLKGAVRGIKLGIEHMGADRGGSGGLVVNMVSMAGIFPMVFGPVYTATKHGINGLTKAWANEPSYPKHKVKIAALCPAIVDTEFIKFQPEQVTDTRLADQVFHMLGILPKELVTKAFMKLVDDEKCNGRILTITNHNGIHEHRYVVGKSMAAIL